MISEQSGEGCCIIQAGYTEEHESTIVVSTNTKQKKGPLKKFPLCFGPTVIAIVLTIS